MGVSASQSQRTSLTQSCIQYNSPHYNNDHYHQLQVKIKCICRLICHSTPSHVSNECDNMLISLAFSWTNKAADWFRNWMKWTTNYCCITHVQLFGGGHRKEFGRLIDSQYPAGAHPGRQVSPGVFCQVVATHEAALANWTDKLFFPRVSASVARQLVWAGEFPLAAFPLALEGLLTCEKQKTDVSVIFYPT